MIPKTLRVGPYRVKVEVSEAEINAQSNLLKSDLAGMWVWKTSMIVLRPGLSDEATAECLLHEILHAVFTVAGIESEDEERLVNAIAPTLLDTLRRNPKLVDYLTS